MKRLILVIFALINEAYAQFPKVDLPGSEIRKITSVKVPGQEYELQIHLPAGYSNTKKKYPVVYVMDSQWDFPLVSSVYGQQYYDGFIPEVIIVGVTWGGEHPNPDSLRARDYTPTNESRLPQSGGAEKFLSFMKEELFPFIETNYNASDNDRTLMGCSLGGLVTLYALFTHPGMFNGYIAASPAIGWDKEVIYKYEQEFYAKKEKPAARLFMTIGGVERNVPGFEKLKKFLADRNYSTVHIKSTVLVNTGHSGTKSETYNRGLQYVFERPVIDLNAAILDRYTGSYESANGNKITIKKESNQLALYFGDNNRYVLYGASETDFYAVSEFLYIYFKYAGGILSGFQLERYGSSQFIKKTN